MPSCASCGRANDTATPYCASCGVSTPGGSAGVATAVAVPPNAYVPTASAATVSAAMETAPTETAPTAHACCAHCGAPLAARAPEAPGGATADAPVDAPPGRPMLAQLDDAGDVAHSYTMERDDLLVGRATGDIRFPDDVYLSPMHASFALRDGALWVRDLGSRNGTWLFIDRPFRLADGDIVLVGSQLLRFRRLGYPGPHPPEADATRRLGSLVPSADVAVLEQLRGDGSVRDTMHLSPGRVVAIGRDHGDWVFPYDQTMSGRHAEVRSDDSEFVMHDLGSRNGIALAVRGERRIEQGQRVLFGDQIVRVERV